MLSTRFECCGLQNRDRKGVLTRQLQNRAHHGLSFFLDLFQVVGAAKTFGVNLVDIFGAGRTGGEPAAFGDHFDAADRIAIARRGGQNVLNFFARQFGDR